MSDQAQDGVLPTRIDNGIKRGPHRLSVPRRRDPETGQVQAIPPGLDHKEVLARYLSEDTTSQIAASYGVTRKSLVAWLREVAPKEWKAVQLIRAHVRKEDGNEGIEDARDPLSLARAREIVRSAQWELQALDPDYQPKQQFVPQIQTPIMNVFVVSGHEQQAITVSSQRQVADAALPDSTHGKEEA